MTTQKHKLEFFAWITAIIGIAGAVAFGPHIAGALLVIRWL